MTKKFAVIGSGPTSSGLIATFANQAASLKGCEVHVFEKSSIFGAGLPYDETLSDPQHLLNITIKRALSADSDNFLQWLKAEKNRQEIRSKFQTILQHRKAKKLALCTDEISRQNIEESYENIWHSIESRYLNFETSEHYHPRILYGIYASIVFENNLEKLRQAGVNVVLHPSTEAVSLDRDGNLGYRKQGSAEAELAKFDEVILAPGHWQKKQKIEGDEKRRYVNDIWPSSLIKDRVDELVTQAKAQNKSEIKIAIEGSALSAIDMAKTIFGDGYFSQDGDELKFTPLDESGVKIHVDMISRNSTFQSVKGNLHVSENLLQAPELRALSAEKDIKPLLDAQGGKLYFWQVIKLVLERIKEAYEKFGDEKRAVDNRIKTLSSLLKIIEDDSKDKDPSQFNYKKLLEKFDSFFEQEDAFQRLSRDLDESQKGDAIDGQTLIWQLIYRSADNFTLAPYMPAEDVALRIYVMDRLHRQNSEGLPPESAREILALHKAGMLEMKKADITSKKVCPKDDYKIAIGDTNYDLVINTIGNAFGIMENQSELVSSMKENGILIAAKTPFCNRDQLQEKLENVEERLGRKVRLELEKRLKEDGDNFYLERPTALIDSSTKKPQHLPDRGIILVSGGGISGADHQGRVLAKNILAEMAQQAIPNPSFAGNTPAQPALTTSQNKTLA